MFGGNNNKRLNSVHQRHHNDNKAAVQVQYSAAPPLNE